MILSEKSATFRDHALDTCGASASASFRAKPYLPVRFYRRRKQDRVIRGTTPSALARSGQSMQLLIIKTRTESCSLHVCLMTEPFGHIDRPARHFLKIRSDDRTVRSISSLTQRRTMFRYRERSELTYSGEGGGDWVDFPASPEPDPWAALMREANRLRPGVSGVQRGVRQEAKHQIAPFARGRRAEPETVTAKNG
jgi:hypothetical protein